MRHLLAIGFLMLQLLAFGQSIFAEGNWYKIGVVADGVYKLDASFFSQTIKANLATLDPRTVKVYGKGGGILPQSNADFRYSDPPENAIYAFGEADGKLDAGDYFLFNGQSPHLVSIVDQEIVRERNIYSDTTYYYLTFGGENGKRMEVQPNESTTGTIVSTYSDFIYHEVDENNILSSGREWFGEGFGSGSGFATELVFSYSILGIQDSLHVYSELIGASEGDCSFELSLNDNLIERVEIDSIPTDPGNPFAQYSNKGNRNVVETAVTGLSTTDVDFKLHFNRSPTPLITSRGYLDFFVLSFERTLAQYGNPTLFRGEAGGFAQTYQISFSGQNPAIWDVTDPLAPQIREHQLAGAQVQFTQTTTGHREFVLLSGSDFPAPTYFGSVKNQNLKANTQLDGIIIAYPAFRAQAEKLADFHRNHDQLAIAVVTPAEIYQEFSSGMQDITAIRDYIRYVWLGGNRLKYVCLFGDASYDYKRREIRNQNLVPVYESRDSFHAIFSYSSDDYYGFMEEDEGEWVEQRTGDHTLEIGVGRLPVKTVEEAEAVVNKIIRYATSENTFGKWRSRIVYLADDGDLNRHMRDVESLYERIEQTNPEYEVKRLYLDDFPQLDEESPALVQALRDQMKNGAFIIDYLGHGSPSILMEERVVTPAFVDDLTNRFRLPMLVTATCDFGKYDDPRLVSGAELFLLHPNAGAIALLTTTRPVFANTNLPMNEAFHDYVFVKENDEYLRLGDIVRLTKNNSLEGPVNRNFTLLGDPMLRLTYPNYSIIFDELDVSTDTLKALELVTLQGSVRSGNAIDEDFDGKATITVLDMPQERVTLGQQGSPFAYEEQSNALFRGDVTVTGGRFDVSFIIPKNTSYKYENGKILAYALDENRLIDAAGASRNFKLGGTAAFQFDQISPNVFAYLNDESFKSGETVGPSSLLIVKVSDESGLNLSTNGFEQGIFLTLNEEDPILLNDFYTADLDSYQQGTIVYPLQDLLAGAYTATIIIRDSYNNAATAQVQFKVSDQPKLRLFNVLNYPNPIRIYQETRFSFEHDREGEPLAIRLTIYDGRGNVVNRWEYLNDESTRIVDDLTWVPTTAGGQPLLTGIYYYKVEVKSKLDGAANEATGRMIIHN